MTVYTITFVLAFCSIAYELLLGQALSAFLGNTVLRYSVTIGLYMLSLGIGSLIAEGRLIHRPVLTLLLIEVFLTLSGGGSVVLLFLINSQASSPWTIFSIAHGLIILIGILSGFEIPLLIKIKANRTPDADNSIIGVNYLGAFLGTVVFAFVLYPYAGIIATPFWIAICNALMGLLLLTQINLTEPSERKPLMVLFFAMAILTLVLMVMIWRSEDITESLLGLYLEG